MMQPKELMDRFRQKYTSENVPIPGQPLLELVGNCRVIIENHCGITGYGLNEICVRIKKGAYVICGTGLNVVKMDHNALVIIGRIEAIRYCGGESQ